MPGLAYLQFFVRRLLTVVIITAIIYGIVLMPATPFGDLNPIQRGFVASGLDPVLLILVFFSWMPYARLTSANVVQLKRTPVCAMLFMFSHRGRSGGSLDLMGGLWYSSRASFIELHSPTLQAAVLPLSGK